MCWDEAYYFPAYIDVWDWVKMLFTHPGTALSGEGIAAGWAAIHELPPLTKWLMAPLAAMGGGGHPLETVRLVPAALFGATVALLFVVARRRTTLPWALLAALAYAFHPRLFGHAHFAATETIFAFVTMLAILAADGDIHKWGRKALLAAIAGLALATKVNGLILIAALLIWLAIRAAFHFSLSRNNTDERRRALSHSVTAGLIVIAAPIVAFLLWPWMWHDTGARLAEYWHFIREHSHQGVWYLGRKWNFPIGVAPRAPWHYPLVMTAVASPVVFAGLALAAIGAALTRLWKNRQAIEPLDILLLLLVAGPIAANMLPSSPKYDGIRLFFPAFLPMALLIGRLGPKVGTESTPRQAWRVAGGLILLLVVTGVPGLTRGLGYYNLPTRLLAPKGEDFPFEVTYWGESLTNGVLEDLNQTCPSNARIRTLAMHTDVLRLQQKWGRRLRPDIQFDGEPPYDFHLMQNRKGFWSNTEWWFRANREPLRSWPENAGPPLLFLFDGRPPGIE